MSQQREGRRLLRGLLFISPWLVGLVGLQLYPYIASFYYSLTTYSGISQPVFVGIRNYADLMRDQLFWLSLYNTLYYTCFSLVLGTMVALGWAVLLNRSLWGMSLIRSLFFLPTVMPIVALSIAWLWLLNPQFGIVNAFLASLGLPTVGWLSDPAMAKLSLVIMGLWSCGGAMVIYLAGLKEVPVEMYESASLDGAGAWSCFWNITIPLISPVILFNVITGVIAAFQYFSQAYVMTKGGPADSTLFYALYLYRNAFAYFKMGYASGQAWILFLLVLVATMLIFKTSARYTYYGGN